MRISRFSVLSFAAVLALTGCATGAPAGVSPGAGADATDGADLVVYVGRNEDHVRPLVELFEEQTGLTVDARYGSTGELATTVSHRYRRALKKLRAAIPGSLLEEFVSE